MADEKITGHCVCKRYTITTSRPEKMNLCHCTDCRRWSGAMYSAHIFANRPTTTIDGPDPRTHTIKGQNGSDMTRAWCDECGSGLWIDFPGSGELIALKAGLFNPGDIPAPSHETFTKNMENWEKVAPGVKQFEENIEGLGF